MGLALVAGSVVAAVNWSDMVDETNKTMKVSGIVVGANADPMDSTAAGNLAAALASKYSYDKPTTVTETVPVEGTAGLSAADAKSKKETVGYNEFSMTKAQLTGFLNESRSMVVSDVSKSVYLKEEMLFKTTSEYNTSKTVQELVSGVTAGNFEYLVNVGSSGLDLDTNAYESDSENYITMPFLGEWYELDVASSTDNKIELVSEGDKDNWLNEGETVTGLASKDGTTTYMVKVADAYTENTSNYVILELYDEATSAKIATETVGADETIRFRAKGKELLQESIKVKEIAKRTVSSSDSFKVNIRTGLNRVVLKDGKCYPNFEDTASKTKCDWKANVTFTTATNVLESYGVETTNTYTSSSALKVNDSLVLPNNYGAVQFLGLTAEDSFMATFGTSVEGVSGNASDYGFSYYDADDVLRSVPYYFLEEGIQIDADLPEPVYVTVDNQDYTLFLQRDGNDLLYLIEAGEIDENTEALGSLDVNFFLDIEDDMNVSDAITFGEGDVDMNYNVMLSNYSGSTDIYNLWLTLAPQTFDMKVGTLEFMGTDTDENIDNSVEAEYYMVNHEDFVIADVDDDDYYSALFNVADVSGADINVLVDTTTGLLTADGDTENGNSYAVMYGTKSLRTKVGERKLYIDENVSLEIVDDEVLELLIAEDVRRAEYLFFDSTMITAEGATKEVTTTKMVKTPYAGMPTVMTDVAAGAGNYIVVGGYAVNSLFAEVAIDATAAAKVFGDALAEAGNKVTKVINGSLYVAGYTKEDTMDAVNALIDELNL